eukprot:m.72026 g.72026  ORF g.72026 m.72026 type:complete len:422 (-) comp13845_c0_seq1:268-1533(-)
MSRRFDVIVYGASGFTGALVVEYIAKNYRDASLTWAIAGRNEQKLKDVRDSLAGKLKDESLKSLDVVVADAHDIEALTAMVKTTKVVLSTAGPFWLHGSDLVKACAENGTSYCDITGESPWVKEMIEEHDATAKEKKCRIVNFCGMDSIPSDTGCYLVGKTMRDTYNCNVARTNGYIVAMKGGVSGGTLASMCNIFEHPNFANIRKELGSPYELIPRESRPECRQPNANAPSYEEDVGRYTSPFVMAGVNSKIVHRTNFLLNNIYGPSFQYCEKMTVKPQGATGYLTSLMVTAGLGALAAGLYFSLTRSVLKRFMPQSGEGPDEATRESGKLVMHFYGVGDTESAPRVTASVVLHRDPGYAETAKMVAESALCLALDSDKLPETYGFLTPMAAMGDTLIKRLQDAGIDLTAEPKADMPSRL